MSGCEAVIVDKRLDGEHYMYAFVEGWGDVRFTLSPYKARSSFRVGSKVVALDADVRAVGTKLVDELL